MDYNNGFSLSSLFLGILSFLWIGAQFPQEKFLSYARILTLDYYFLLMCILFSIKYIYNFLRIFGLRLDYNSLWSRVSRFFSFLEFSVIYWIRNNFHILCYVLLLTSQLFYEEICKVGALLTWSSRRLRISLDCDWTMVPRGFSHNKRLLTLWSFNLCWQRSFSLERSVCKVWTHVSELSWPLFLVSTKCPLVIMNVNVNMSRPTVRPLQSSRWLVPNYSSVRW